MGTPGTVTSKQTNVILFDGMCNLCNGAVQFVLKRDTHRTFQFASLQSAYGQQQLIKFGLDPQSLHSIILIRDAHFFQQSDAALEIARQLKYAWPLLYGFKIIPRFIRDGVYAWIANNRYRFFGKREACWIPTPELKERFLE
jgi:predicted DCC family thiol-disulfide oxidoreductase YuxK